MGPHTSVFSTGIRSSSILLLSLPEISLSIRLNYHSRPRMPSKSTVRINRAVSAWTVIPSVVGPPSPSLVEKRRQPATSQLSVAWRFWHQNGGALAEEVRERSAMEAATEELERRSRYLSSLVERTKIEAEGKEKINKGEEGEDDLEELPKNMKVRAADMPRALQRRAFRCAREALAVMPKLDSKRLALALKKEFDSSCGPAWHCVVGTSFGSYVTHSLGGFLYFSIDKVYILLFRTAVEPLVH